MKLCIDSIVKFKRIPTYRKFSCEIKFIICSEKLKKNKTIFDKKSTKLLRVNCWYKITPQTDEQVE